MAPLALQLLGAYYFDFREGIVLILEMPSAVTICNLERGSLSRCRCQETRHTHPPQLLRVLRGGTHSAGLSLGLTCTQICDNVVFFTKGFFYSTTYLTGRIARKSFYKHSCLWLAWDLDSLENSVFPFGFYDHLFLNA